MNNWRLRTIKLAALALITFPEPVTTGIGVVTLVWTCFMAKKHEDEVLERFKQVLREHLIRTGHLEYVMSVSHHRQNKAKQHLVNLNTEKISKTYTFTNYFASKASEKVVYHSVYIPLHERQYIVKSRLQPFTQDTIRRSSIPNDEVKPSEKMIQHKLNIPQTSYSYQPPKIHRPVNHQKTPSRTYVINNTQGSRRFAMSLDSRR